MQRSFVMPIFEFYCPDNHKIYQFYAKTQAQAARVPKCPENPRFRMQKLVSRFAVNTGSKEPSPDTNDAAGREEHRMDAAMDQIEREFSHVDENDPRAMGRMMRRMAELSGEKVDGEMEEVVRKLEEGMDPEELGDRMGGDDDDASADPMGDGGAAGAGTEKQEKRARYRARRSAPIRDPRLYDYD